MRGRVPEPPAEVGARAHPGDGPGEPLARTGRDDEARDLVDDDLGERSRVGGDDGPTGGVALNDFATTSVPVQPGGTVMIGTRDGNPGGFTLDKNLALPTFAVGSARIVATTTKLLCNVFVVDAISFSVSWPLNVVAKTKQKAAN